MEQEDKVKLFEKYRFKCPKKCEVEKELIYQELLDHLYLECSKMQFLCPFRCDKITWYKPQEIMNHMQVECLKQSYDCKDCGQQVMKKVMEGHKCSYNDPDFRAKKISEILDKGLENKEV
mmetsp:Transcript_18332/g.17452  ORF Transcript_18332/g.17452 Transcript_18332/m.17452 type:complete len:120 (-) Transcript_18332:207-566(-)